MSNVSVLLLKFALLFVFVCVFLCHLFTSRFVLVYLSLTMELFFNKLHD